jgi:hypothetical protein
MFLWISEYIQHYDLQWLFLKEHYYCKGMVCPNRICSRLRVSLWNTDSIPWHNFLPTDQLSGKVAFRMEVAGFYETA